MQKNANDVTRYSVPIVLWSVVVSHLTTTLPGCLRRTGSSFSYESSAARGTLGFVEDAHSLFVSAFLAGSVCSMPAGM